MPRKFLLYDPRLREKVDPEPEAKAMPHQTGALLRRLRRTARMLRTIAKKLLMMIGGRRLREWPTDHEEWFAEATWKGAHELRKILDTDEDSFRTVSGYSHLDARSFYLFAVLDEIQKTSVAIRRWMEFLQDSQEGQSVNPKDPIRRVILESVLDEQDFRRRRLLEILVDLICFRATNEQDYYRHYMLLRQLQYGLTVREDFRRFYGFVSERLTASLDPEVEWIHQLEDRSIESSRCWYRRSQKNLGNSPRPGQLFSSFRYRLGVALPEATESERLVLGLSYYAYSWTSSRVHFQVVRHRFANFLEEGRIGVSRIGVLALNVLVACQELFGQVPDGINEGVREVLGESEEIANMFESAIGKRAVVGSFVVAYREKLAEVLETRTSDFGYESYRVRFLEEDVPYGIEEDWLPPQEIRRLYDLDHFAEDVRTELVRKGVPPDRLDESSIRKSVRRAMIETWKAGLRDVVLRRTRRQD